MEQMIQYIKNSSSDFSDIGMMNVLQKHIFREENCSCDVVDLFHMSPLTYFVWDAEKEGWPVKNVSPNIFGNFGYDSIDFLSGKLKFIDIIHPQDRERIQKEVSDNIFEKRIQHFEQYYRIIDGEGNVRFIYDKTEVIYDSFGKISKLYGFIMDISKEHESEVLKDEYKKALDNSAIVQIVDKNGIIQYVNNLYKEISGDKRNLVGRRASIMGGRKYHSPEFWKEMWETLLAGNIWRGIVQNPRMDMDTSFYTQSTITPLRDESGEITHFIAVKFNITELQETKKVLKSSKKRLEKILNSTSQGFWIINEDLVIQDVNSAFCDLTGYDKNEVIGKSIFDFFDTENVVILEKQVHTFRTTDHRIYNIKIQRKEGNNLPIILRATTIRDSDGNITEVIAFLTDVSEMHEASKKDALTGVQNRGTFDFDLDNYFTKINEGNGSKVAIAIFDIDLFKRINDEYGHPIGDVVLRKIGSMLRAITTKNLQAYRYGGEEFVLLGKEMNMEELRLIIESFRVTIENTEIDIQNGRVVNFTISAGVASFQVGEGENNSPKELFVTADSLLYRAKKSGRNCVMPPIKNTLPDNI